MEDQTDFYLHLISDASLDYYPSNVISNFTTKFSREINLKGQWQVALCNISYHKTWGNISTRDEGGCLLRLYQKTNTLEPKGKLHAMLEPGQYSTPQSLIDALLKAFTNIKQGEEEFNLEDILSITHNVHTNKLSFGMKQNSYGCDALKLTLSPTILNLMGHHEYTNTKSRDLDIRLALIPGKEELTFTGIVDLRSGIHNIFCYSSLVRNVTVGDTQAPLLRIIPVLGGDGEYVYQTFEDRQYLPVVTNNFNTANSLIGDRFGNKIKFEHGSAPVILVLHLKRVA